MAITAQQAAVIKADILANPDLAAQPMSNAGSAEIARLYNVAASPDWWAWRTNVSESDLVSKPGPDGTQWSWSAYIARTQGERDAWERIFNGTKSCNPSLSNVRSAFADIFSGSSGAGQRAHLSASCRRLASRVEKLLGIGTGSTAVPGLMGYEGPITSDEIQYARELP
jgi:hypothetical protein